MKLYDIIRKEDIDQGTPLKEIPTRTKHILSQKTYQTHKRFVWKKVVVVALAIVFIALLYVVGMKIVRATVSITERSIPFTLDGTEFDLEHEGEGSQGRLSYQTMIVPAEAMRQVYGSDVQPSTTFASGKVVFFNEYSTKPQTIRAKSTLTSANKKTYQTTTTVIVPGYTLNGKVKIAGTSSATPIQATAAGSESNTDGTSFTIAGWAGSLSKRLYAQSAGIISGGEQGIAHSVANAEQGDVIATLQTQLTEKLKRETRAQIPDALIAFPDLQVVSVDNDSLQLKGSTIKFPASIKGEMVSYLIPREILETAIAKAVLSDHSYAHVSIPTLANLTVTPVSALPTDSKNAPEILKVKISGQGTIITKAPLERIKESLVGAPKRNFASILASVPEVDMAQYHFYPFWAPFFPTNSSRITIETR